MSASISEMEPFMSLGRQGGGSVNLQLESFCQLQTFAYIMHNITA